MVNQRTVYSRRFVYRHGDWLGTGAPCAGPFHWFGERFSSHGNNTTYIRQVK